MWHRYRIVKPAAGLLLAVAALLLLNDQPAASPRWFVGMGVSAGLILAYVGEEIVWIARNGGRPCSQCGCPLRVKPFRLHVRCPHCGEPQ